MIELLLAVGMVFGWLPGLALALLVVFAAQQSSEPPLAWLLLILPLATWIGCGLLYASYHG